VAQTFLEVFSEEGKKVDSPPKLRGCLGRWRECLGLAMTFSVEEEVFMKCSMVVIDCPLKRREDVFVNGFLGLFGQPPIRRHHQLEPRRDNNQDIVGNEDQDIIPPHRILRDGGVVLPKGGKLDEA